MKYRIRKFSDAFDLSQEAATEMAKEKLLETKFYAAVYGKKIKGKQIFHEPLLVNKDVLEEMKHEIIEEDPKAGALYVLYRSSLTDAPLYEVEEDKGYIDIPDKEVEDFVKKRIIEIVNNSRLFEKYKKDLIYMLEEDLQDYAEREFYEKGRGTKFEDSDTESDIAYQKFSEEKESALDFQNEYSLLGDLNNYILKKDNILFKNGFEKAKAIKGDRFTPDDIDNEPVDIEIDLDDLLEIYWDNHMDIKENFNEFKKNFKKEDLPKYIKEFETDEEMQEDLRKTFVRYWVKGY